MDLKKGHPKMTTEKHNHEYCKILCAEDVWNMTRDELFMWQSKNVKFLKETYTEAFHALIDKQKLEAKNAALTLQNEALRDALIESNSLNINWWETADVSTQEHFSEAPLVLGLSRRVLSQPTPDPDKISAVVNSAVELLKEEDEEFKHFIDTMIAPDISKKEWIDISKERSAPRWKSFRNAVEALLNDTKGVG